MSLSAVINKTILKYSLAASLFAFSAGIAPSCTTTPASDKQQLELIQHLTLPLYSHKDLEINKHNGSMVLYDHEVSIKPPFYKGSVPFSYTSTETQGRGYTYGSYKMLRHEFNLTKKLKRATAYICGLGLFELYLNGKRI